MPPVMAGPRVSPASMTMTWPVVLCAVAMARMPWVISSGVLTERNTVALKVLEKEMKAGRKNLAIFYGAAHMPDIEKRMIKNMGFERKATRWLTAWDLPARRK